MALTRRQFLKLTGASTLGAVAFVACAIPQREFQVQSPVNLPEDLATGLENWYATLCTQCPTPHGIVVRVMSGRAKKIEGNPDFPLNRGKHLARCEAALQALYHPDRIETPLRRNGERGSGLFEPISWEEALNLLTARLQQQEGAPNSILLTTEPLSGHLGLVTRRFARALGALYATYEPLGESAVLHHAVSNVFGQDRLPDFDIENTRFLLSFGADFLSTWVSPLRYSRGYGEFRQGAGRERGTFVQVDSRFSMTAANADQWVPIKPGTEGVLALSLAYVIKEQRGESVADLQQFNPGAASAVTGVSPERITKLAQDFAANQPSLAIGGGSAAAHTNGLFNLKAIYALNYLVGSVGKRAGQGGVVFNPDPILADLAATATTASFDQWQDLREQISSGQIKLLLTRGINPVHGLAALKLRDALNRDDLFVTAVSSFMDDTAAMADLVLPEHTPLEDWGDAIPDPGPGHQLVALQQPVVRPRLDTRGFGDILLTLADSLGGQVAASLPWASFKDVLRSGIQQLYDSPDRNDALADWRSTSFETFWTRVLQHGGWWDQEATFRGPFSPIPIQQVFPSQAPQPQFAGATGEDSFHLLPFASNTLGDGRGAHLPWLQGTPDPITTLAWTTWVEMNSAKAATLGLKEGDIVTVQAPNGSFDAPVYPHPGMPPDVVAVPLGQGHVDFGRYARGRGSNPLAVLAALRDDDTDTLAWAATRVKLTQTGTKIPLPKMEGSQFAQELEPGHIIQIADGKDSY